MCFHRLLRAHTPRSAVVLGFQMAMTQQHCLGGSGMDSARRGQLEGALLATDTGAGTRQGGG